MTAKKSSRSKKSESKAKAKQSRSSIAQGGSTPARGSATPSDSREAQREADRAQAGAEGNEAAIRRSRAAANVAKLDAVNRGEVGGESAAPSDKETQKAAGQLAKEFPGQVLGTSGTRAAGATDAATADLSKRQQVVAEHTVAASHGALHVREDVSAGFIDPIPEGGRPKGGGSPTLGEHVVGDTEFKGSRGKADTTPGAGKGQKTGAASLAAANLPRGFKPGKSAESEQRDAAYDGNRAAAAAPRGAGQRQASGKTVKVIFVATDYRQNGPADINPNSTTVVLKAAQGTLGGKENEEFFGGVAPSGTIALNAFSTEYDDAFAIGEVYEVTIKQRSGAKK